MVESRNHENTLTMEPGPVSPGSSGTTVTLGSLENELGKADL